MKNRVNKGERHPLLSALFYILIFLTIQVFITLAVSVGWMLYEGKDFEAAMRTLASGPSGDVSTQQIIVSAVSSLLTIALFMACRWSDSPRRYIRTRPWSVIFWVAVLALGIILPAIWLQDTLQLEVPAETEAVFKQIIGSPLGYFVIGILVPIAEETVFRGAVLRVLLSLFSRKFHWIAILLSALLFGAIHLNMAQGVHATLVGLLLGWLYYRTGSIVPGIVLHWMNNSVAFAIEKIFPEWSDASLSEIMGGNERAVILSLIFSLCIILPSIFQLHLRMKNADEG